VTDLGATPQTASGTEPADSPAADDPARPGSGRGLALTMAALGIVFGDIGTSPLYAMQTVFALDGGTVRPSSADVFGVVSLVFWSITLIVTVKYVVFVLRVSNDGEGGVMALAALAGRALGSTTSRRTALLLALGVLGASLFYGDSVITPAISVLSAVEGLKVVGSGLATDVVPIAAVILTLLFAAQRWGTERVGGLFGPIMIIWFAGIGATGLLEVVRHPGVLRGLSPTCAAAFVADRPAVAFVAMGAVVLAITGAEALYADLGHFGAGPIRRAWFLAVFPALTVNYLAQASIVLRDPRSRTNPFFLLVPHWALVPMVVLATAATVIASQAVISGAFSVSRQALRLGYLPRLRIRQTSTREYGQIYVPAVNWVLFVAVLLVVLTFRSSSSLASAYGVAVTGTFLITTTLFLVVARTQRGWTTWKLVLFGLVFGAVEATYFSANLTKVTHGGWLTLLIAAIVFTVMLTWQRGRKLVTARRTALEGPLSDFLATLHEHHVPRVPGVAVVPHPDKRTTPLALRAAVEHFHSVHQHVLIITGRTAKVPHIPWEQRLTVDHLGVPDDGVVHILAEFGFQDPTDFPEVLRRAAATGVEGLSDPGNVSFLVSRITIRRTRQPGMAAWRKALFIALAHNAASQAEYLGLPEHRTVDLSAEVPL
jgi:KUP system potassium uptake protein